MDTLLHDGVPVLRVVPGSPAAAAGLQPGDVVLGADGQAVKRTADLIAGVAAKKPGDKVILQVRGVAVGSAARSVDLTLGSVLKYSEDQEVIRAAGLEQLVGGGD